MLSKFRAASERVAEWPEWMKDMADQNEAAERYLNGVSVHLLVRPERDREPLTVRYDEREDQYMAPAQPRLRSDDLLLMADGTYHRVVEVRDSAGAQVFRTLQVRSDPQAFMGTTHVRKAHSDVRERIRAGMDVATNLVSDPEVRRALLSWARSALDATWEAEVAAVRVVQHERDRRGAR